MPVQNADFRKVSVEYIVYPSAVPVCVSVCVCVCVCVCEKDMLLQIWVMGGED